MKKLLFLFILLFSVSVQAQTKRIHVIFKKDAAPVRVYSHMEDYRSFIENKPFFSQEVKFYDNDSSEFKPSLQQLTEDMYYPV